MDRLTRPKILIMNDIIQTLVKLYTFSEINGKFIGFGGVVEQIHSVHVIPLHKKLYTYIL